MRYITLLLLSVTLSSCFQSKTNATDSEKNDTVSIQEGLPEEQTQSSSDVVQERTESEKQEFNELMDKLDKKSEEQMQKPKDTVYSWDLGPEHRKIMEAIDPNRTDMSIREQYIQARRQILGY